MPRRPGAGERERSSTGDTSFGGTYRDRQVTSLNVKRQFVANLYMYLSGMCDHSHCIN